MNIEDVKLPIFKKIESDLKKLGLDTEIFCFAFGDPYHYTQYNLTILTKNRGRSGYGKVKGFTLPKPFQITKDTKEQRSARRKWLQEQVEDIFGNAELFCSAFPPEDSLIITRMVITNNQITQTLKNEEERSEKKTSEIKYKINGSMTDGSK